MKSLLLLPILLAAVFFTSCKKEYNEYVTPNQTIITDIAASDWKLTSNNTYAVTLSMPEIDTRVNSDFGIVVSVSADGNTFEAIPEVYAGYSYSFTHQPGSLTIESQGLNGQAGTAPPGITIKIVLIESQP